MEATDIHAEIRRQVEWYFSDENLIGDMFLLGKMKGRKNNPIPLKLIHNFKKMQCFQPQSLVEEALSTSNTTRLVMESGVVCVQRLHPFVKEDVLAREDKSTTKHAKKKGSTKSNALTGFELGFVEPPVTPQEHQEECVLYSKDLPFGERLESALQQFAKKRRFISSKANIFNKWMRFGGVDAGPKMFTSGPDKAELELHDARGIANMTATNFISLDRRLDQDMWIVDFSGVAKSFFSTIFPEYIAAETEQEIKEGVQVVRSFYNFLLLHDVCPEYQSDIKSAIQVCSQADQELFYIRQAHSALPGAFNVACSTLFGGFYQGLYVGDCGWQKASDADKLEIGLSQADATIIFSLWVSAHEADKMTGDLSDNKSSLLNRSVTDVQENIGLEIVDVINPTEELRQAYAMVPGSFKPPGKIRCRDWVVPSDVEDDIPARAAQSLKEQATYEFYVEEPVLQWCMQGMKLEATVRTLHGGLRFLDSVSAVYCSFYTVLANELIIGKWREPRWISREERLAREARGDEQALQHLD